MAIDLSADLVELTRAVIDAPSQSLHEEDLADAIEDALCRCSHLEIERLGNSLVARTQLGRAERVVIAGHIDTVTENANLPSSVRGEDVWGLGSCDMKGGLSIALKLAHDVSAPCRDVTWVFYEAEEIAAIHNGLGKLARERPELLEADFAILMEPSDAGVEAGCQGTLRVFVQAHGERSHSARAWMGTNAIHSLAPALDALANYTPRDVDIDGLVYREGLNAVGISGGVAGNVIPDAAQIVVNYRFAPDRGESEALAHVREVFDGFDVLVDDSAPGALPGLSQPAARDFIAAVGGNVGPKFGWTDVAKFTQLGIPAVNYGPGDPSYAHKADERVPIAQLYSVYEALLQWLA